jgi:glucose-6-phosphate 1-epimerase
MDRPEGVSVRLAAPAPPSSFPHSYKLTYVVTLSAHQLSTDVHVENTSDKEDFMFHALLHNYLAVPDARKIKIGGLDKGIEYRDKVKGETLTWEGGDLTITGETDRYVDRPVGATN